MSTISYNPHLVPLLYPGVKVSYGTIQQMLVEAEARAARFNAQASLGGVEAGALDEMFSQGEPVLAGVDLDSGYLFGLSLSATRDGEAWAELLREGQCQGLELSVVVRPRRHCTNPTGAAAPSRHWTPPTPSTACLGTGPLVCVKMNCRILIGPLRRLEREKKNAVEQWVSDSYNICVQHETTGIPGFVTHAHTCAVARGA